MPKTLWESSFTDRQKAIRHRLGFGCFFGLSIALIAVEMGVLYLQGRPEVALVGRLSVMTRVGVTVLSAWTVWEVCCAARDAVIGQGKSVGGYVGIEALQTLGAIVSLITMRIRFDDLNQILGYDERRWIGFISVGTLFSAIALKNLAAIITVLIRCWVLRARALGKGEDA